MGLYLADHGAIDPGGIFRRPGETGAYVKTTAVGREIIVPLFLEPEHYVNVPLETTYLAAYQGMPRRWRELLERV